MKIKTIDYTRHVIGDNVALSFDDFYEDLTELRQNCPAHSVDTDYPKYDNEYLENSCESDKLKYEVDTRLVLEPEMKDRLYPRLLPQSPAGTVSKIISNNHILDTLNPIIKEVYDKDVTNASSQCISSTFWDYENHIDAWNVYNENVVSAYWDECFEQGKKCLGESTIADPNAWEEAKAWVKNLRECEPRTVTTKDSIEEIWSDRPVYKSILNKGKFFYEYLPKSRRLKLQNHPNRPQWLPDGSFICIVFLDFNTDPKYEEIPEIEFWKHKPMFPTEEGRHKITEKDLLQKEIMAQLFYYETWHYGVFGEEFKEIKNMSLTTSVWDKHHTSTEYDLINSIQGKINNCILFPGEYFHKIAFPRAYIEQPMRTQIMVLE
jgi:hypothetical protein